MAKNYTQFPKKFVTYPTNRITCDFADVRDFLDAMDTFKKEGYDISRFYILHGAEGVKALDPDGVEHGFLAIVRRFVHNLMSEEERHSIEDIVNDLAEGGVHVAVPAARKDLRDRAHEIMDEYHGMHITYFARLYIETWQAAS